MRLLFVLFTPFLIFAGINIRTNVHDVYYLGDSEQVGAIAVEINGDAFPTASPINPDYIRIRLLSDTVLAETLVDLPMAESRLAEPIYLAGRILSNDLGIQANVPKEAIAIVRWRADENEIWLRIEQPSSEWVVDGGLPGPPTLDHRVDFLFGTKARNAWNLYIQDYNNGRANLPANTRWVSQSVDPQNDSRGWAISTILCTDLSRATIQPFPSSGSELHVDIQAFDESTTGVITALNPGDIIPGLILPASITGDSLVARGIDPGCAATIPLLDPTRVIRCQNNVTVTPNLVPMTNTIRRYLFCDYGWNRNSILELGLNSSLDTSFLIETDGGGSPIPVDIDGDGLYFAVSGVQAIQPNTDFVWGAPEGLTFFDGSNWRAYGAFGRYVGPDYWAPQIDIESDVTVYSPVAIVDEIVQVTVELSLKKPSRIEDYFPFDGTLDDGDPMTGVTAYDQRAFCSPSTIRINSFYSTMGLFEACPITVPTLSSIGLLSFVCLLSFSAWITMKKTQH